MTLEQMIFLSKKIQILSKKLKKCSIFREKMYKNAIFYHNWNEKLWWWFQKLIFKKIKITRVLKKKLAIFWIFCKNRWVWVCQFEFLRHEKYDLLLCFYKKSPFFTKNDIPLRFWKKSIFFHFFWSKILGHRLYFLSENWFQPLLISWLFILSWRILIFDFTHFKTDYKIREKCV